jgi:hypothetical protein
LNVPGSVVAREEAGSSGDRDYAMLPAIGHNLRPALNWRRLLLCLFLAALLEAMGWPLAARTGFLMGA